MAGAQEAEGGSPVADGVLEDGKAPPEEPTKVDYSKFDDISDSDDESVDSGEAEAKWPAEERVARAESCKISGNERFVAKDDEEALKLYAKGVKALEPLKELEAPELREDLKRSQVGLLVSLQLNKAAVEIRQERWAPAAESASAALVEVERNASLLEDSTKWLVKGLFRRAQARRKLGDLEEAKSDLVRLLTADRSSKDALREYAALKKQLAEFKAQEKKQYQAAFEKASQTGGMYKDREIERKRKQLQKIEEERKRREQWNKEVEEDGSGLSFEDWCKRDDERKAKEKREQEERDKERKRAEDEARRARAAEERKRREEAGEDEVELDEEDLKALSDVKKKGYCYFRTQHTEEEKALLAAAAHTKPSKITSAVGSQDSTGSNSAWNANGTTWEERDVSAAAKEGLKAALAGVSREETVRDVPVKTTVRSVTSVTGHAQVVVSRGKPAPVYDLSAKLKWAMELSRPADAKPETVKGTISMPDISTGVDDLELEVRFDKPDAIRDRELVMEALRAFQGDLRHASVEALIATVQ